MKNTSSTENCASSPASAKPIAVEPNWAIAISELAAASSSSLATSGRTASLAGSKNCLTDDESSTITYSQKTESPSVIRNGIEATSAAWMTTVTIMIVLRSYRSTNTPGDEAEDQGRRRRDHQHDADVQDRVRLAEDDDARRQRGQGVADGRDQLPGPEVGEVCGCGRSRTRMGWEQAPRRRSRIPPIDLEHWAGVGLAHAGAHCAMTTMGRCHSATHPTAHP